MQEQPSQDKELRDIEHEVSAHVLQSIESALHGNISQLLTVMYMQLDRHTRNNPDTASILQPIKETLNQTIQEVSRLSIRLTDDLAGENVVISAVQYEVERLQRKTNRKIHWTYDYEPRLTEDQRTIALYIFHAILDIILKQSDAHNIRIKLIGEKDFKLIIRNDGKGFDLNKAIFSSAESKLKNIISLVALANLKYSIATFRKDTQFTLEQN